MNRTPKPFEVYRHFKGNYYQILTVAEHSETGEQMVVYQQLYSPFRTYVRPLAMFMSAVDKEKYPNATQEMRFTLQKSLYNAQNDGLYEEYKQNKADMAKQPDTIKQSENRQTVEATADITAAQEEPQLHPMIVEFLDADSYEEKLEILNRMHKEITNEMINTIAASLDIEVKEGEPEERYREVLNCLLMLEKFECNRLR